MEVKFNMIEHYSACRLVMNFICSLQNEKGLLDKVSPKCQGCIYSFRSGILWCLHTFFQFGTCGFKNCMKYLCIVQVVLLSYYWIPVLVQGLNQNYTKSESQDAKWTLENNPILFKKADPLVWGWIKFLILSISRGIILLSGFAVSGERWMLGNMFCENGKNVSWLVYYKFLNLLYREEQIERTILLTLVSHNVVIC